MRSTMRLLVGRRKRVGCPSGDLQLVAFTFHGERCRSLEVLAVSRKDGSCRLLTTARMDVQTARRRLRMRDHA